MIGGAVGMIGLSGDGQSSRHDWPVWRWGGDVHNTLSGDDLNGQC